MYPYTANCSKLTSSPTPQTNHLQQTQRYSNSYLHYSSTNNNPPSSSPYHLITPTTPAKQTLRTQKQYPSISIVPVSLHQPTKTQPSSPFQLMKQVQISKLAIQYLQQQVTNLKTQKEQLQRQKKTINQNYIAMINKDLQNEQSRHNQFNQLKNMYQQQLNTYVNQISYLKSQASHYTQQLHNSSNLFKRQQASLRDAISNLEQQLSRVSSQNHNYLQKLKHYQELIYKKQFQLEETKMKSSILARDLDVKKGEIQKLKQQNLIVIKDNNQFSNKIYDIEHQCNTKQQSISQMTQQIAILLKVDEKAHKELQLHHQTIQNLTKQLHSLNLTHSELLTKTQQLSQSHKHRQNSLLNELNNTKFLQTKLREQNNTLMKHVENLKQRQILLIESEKNARQKLSTSMERKNKQVEDLCQQNQRLYKEINRVKFNNNLTGVENDVIYGKNI